MNTRLRTEAIVLRTRAFQDHDLIVDVLTPDVGRFSWVARGARKSQRRFGGPLEMGTRLDLDVALRPGREMQTVSRCEVVSPLRRIREDISRISALAYILELVRLGSRDASADAGLYGLAVELVDVLEQEAPTAEGVVLWELALLSHLGYGANPQSLAHEMGLGFAGQAVLQDLARGEVTARFSEPDAADVRRGLERIWQRTVGFAPRSGRFLSM